MSTLKLFILIVAFFGFSTSGFASIGDWADAMMGPVSGLGHIMNAICFVSGVGFLLGGLLQFKYHRENPQQVRISTPIILFALGLVVIAFPIFAMLSESGRFLQR